jgi:citrate lyase subunit beta/citryl-CoA lyase
MEKLPQRPIHPRRSVLYAPASNSHAIEKSASLACDAVIYDLEDAVAPDAKADAREFLRSYFDSHPRGAQERIIRINSLSSEWGTEDLLAARACFPDAILVPKVNGPADLAEVEAALDDTDAPASLRLWAMIETPQSVLNGAAIASAATSHASRLDCFVAGTNDLAKETGAVLAAGRAYLVPWLMQIVLAARAGGLDVLDGVWNDFRDASGFGAECSQGAQMGFDGKTLVHPSQIDGANEAFSPSDQELAGAREICEAFDLPKNAGKGVISLHGQMVERLHLSIAEKLIAKAEMIDARL